MNQEIKIIDFKDEMLESVIDLHLKAFRGYLNTKLGKRYLRAFFRWFVENGDISLVAVNRDLKIVGYVVGAKDQYQKMLTKHMFFTVICSFLAKPWLLFQPKVIKIVFNRFMNLFSKTELNSNKNFREISLVGIAVDKNFLGKGIGTKLLDTFEKNAKYLDFQIMKLSVYSDNYGARKSYEKAGWKLDSNLENVCKYQKLIDE